MRKYLTIGELAKLLNISPFTIRYYEKEGLIKPRQLSEKGYRLYDFDDIYVLSGIMILRDSDIPIKTIKQLLDNYSKDSYKEAIQASYKKVSAEIKRLQTLQRELKEVLTIANITRLDLEEFKIKTLPKRQFIVIKSSDYRMDYSIKELFDIFCTKKIDMSDFYKRDLFYYLTDDDISLCILDKSKKKGFKRLTFEKGKYLSYRFHVNHEAELEDRIADIFNYTDLNKVNCTGDLIFSVGAKVSMVSENGYIGELQLQIQ